MLLKFRDVKYKATWRKYRGCKKKLYILKLCGPTRPTPHLARAGCDLCEVGGWNKQLNPRFFQRATGRPAQPFPLCHPQPPTTTANYNRPPNTTSGTTTHHHQRNHPPSNNHQQRHLRNPTHTLHLWQPHTSKTCEPPTTAHLQRLWTSDNRAPLTLANLRRSHTSCHFAPLTTAHLRPLLRYSLNSKQKTHLHSSSIFIIPHIFIHHPPHLK